MSMELFMDWHYIDHNTKCVFNGSDIGKDYSVKSVLERCGVSQAVPVPEKYLKMKMQTAELSFDSTKQHQQHQEFSEIMDAMIKPTEEYQYMPFELKKQKKKNENLNNN